MTLPKLALETSVTYLSPALRTVLNEDIGMDGCVIGYVSERAVTL